MVPLSAAPISQIEQQVRERTLPHLRSEVKDEFRELQQKLNPDDRTLLVLRVDRQLSWDEIAIVMLDSGELSGPDIKKKAASLRKRFERVKERLHAMAEEAGLLADEN
jgi:RNA polymerase sigma-70 factor (ECF subfamily)